MSAPNKIPQIFLVVLSLAVVAGLMVFRGPLKTLFVRSGTSVSAAKAVYYCPMHPTYTSDRPGDCPICNMKLVKREAAPEETPVAVNGPKAFTVEELMAMKPGEICLMHKCTSGACTMIPMTEESARKGKCPGCGEDLGVLVKDVAPDGYTKITLTPDKQKLIGTKTAPAKKTAITKTVRTTGRIAYDPDLYQAEQEFLQAAEALKKAQSGSLAETKDQAARLVDSARLKLKLMGLSDELIQEVETAGKPDRSLLYGEPGGNVWLYAPIYEYEIPLIKVGDKVEVEVPAIPGKSFQGTIRSIDPVLDPATRSVRVRAVLANPDGALKPEMYVNAVLKVDLGVVLVVPEEAVFATGEKNIVFVAKPGGIFEPREVALGAKSESYYEIKSGLGEGEEVVTGGNFLIDSESRLKAALQGMEGKGGSGHKHGQ